MKYHRRPHKHRDPRPQRVPEEETPMSKSPAPAQRVRDQNVSSRLLDALSKHVGIHVTTATLAADSGLSPQQVQAALNHLRTRKGLPVEVLGGGIYLYHPGGRPAAAPSKRLFEELATTRHGTVLVQDEEGTVYKLVEFD